MQNKSQTLPADGRRHLIIGDVQAINAREEVITRPLYKDYEEDEFTFAWWKVRNTTHIQVSGVIKQNILTYEHTALIYAEKQGTARQPEKEVLCSTAEGAKLMRGEFKRQLNSI